MKKVISVRFKENGKSYYFDPAGADIKTGEYVIVESARGIECGEVVQGVKDLIGTDVLGNAAGLAGGNGRIADGIQQRGLAVVAQLVEGL